MGGHCMKCYTLAIIEMNRLYFAVEDHNGNIIMSLIQILTREKEIGKNTEEETQRRQGDKQTETHTRRGREIQRKRPRDGCK